MFWSWQLFFFELLLVVEVQVHQIPNLLLVGLLVACRIISVFLRNVDDLLIKARDFVLKVLTGLSELRNVCLHLILLLLSHERFSHTVGDR